MDKLVTGELVKPNKQLLQPFFVSMVFQEVPPFVETSSIKSSSESFPAPEPLPKERRLNEKSTTLYVESGL